MFLIFIDVRFFVFRIMGFISRGRRDGRMMCGGWGVVGVEGVIRIGAIFLIIRIFTIVFLGRINVIIFSFVFI